MGSVPSTFATGYKYAALGYTTAFDAAVPALSARHAHQEFADTPCLDKGFYVLMGNNHYIMRAIQRGEHERARAFIGLATVRPPRVTLPSSSILAASRCGRAGPQATSARSTTSSRHMMSRRARLSRLSPAASTSCDCLTRYTFTAIILACQATGRRPSRRCRCSRGNAAT